MSPDVTAASGTGGRAKSAATEGPGRTVAGRLRRLLAILAWLAQVGEASIEETAARFGLEPEALVAELELAACCGVPPYTPDQLMEIVVTDTTVSAHLGDLLARPRRLNAREGFALAASARGLLAVPGSDAGGALSQALAKLERALGGDPVVVELDEPALLTVVTDACRSGQSMQIEYYAASSDEVSTRRVDPIRLFSGEGHWYLDAYCHRAGDVRRFRVDRIRSAEVVDPNDEAEPADRRGTAGQLGPIDQADPGVDFTPFVPGPEARSVRLSVAPSVAWMLESVPAAGRPEVVGDRVEVELSVGGDAWLDRLLLRLGRDAQVLSPPDDVDRMPRAAARILARYQGPQAPAYEREKT